MAYFVRQEVNRIMVELLKKHAGDDAMEALLQDQFQTQLLESIKTQMKRKLKDPNAPKKPKSAYMFFAQENREKLKAEMTEAGLPTTGADVTRYIANKWRELQASTKDRHKKKVLAYMEQAHEAKTTYDQLMKEYKKPSDEFLAELKENKKVGRGKGKGTPRAKKDPNAPKGARSAYMFFCQTRRDELKDEELKGAELRARLSEEWKEIYKEERAEFDEKAKEDKARYTEEKKKYDESKGDATPEVKKPGKKTPVESKKADTKSSKKGEKKADTKSSEKGEKKTPVKSSGKPVKTPVHNPEDVRDDVRDEPEEDNEVKQVESMDLGDVEEDVALTPPPAKKQKVVHARVVAAKSGGKPPVMVPKPGARIRSVEDSDEELEDE